LTGTPIQNSLEDLGALVKFLKVPVLEDLALFRRQITTPVLANVSGRFTNLRRLLEATCLRRTKALLNLPEPVTDTQVLELSASESSMYHDFGDLCKHAIDLAVSGHSIKKANQHVIQVSGSNEHKPRSYNVILTMETRRLYWECVSSATTANML
jgi:SWI/SNF-related matrix-associated actin-dependent regulator of chromatin subfamily A3